MEPIYANLITALWTLWLLYWLIAGRDVKATQRHESPGSRATHIVPLIIGALLLWRPTLPGGFLCGKILPPSLALYLVGVVIFVAGLAFTVWARVHLGRNWSASPAMKEGHELVTTGPYAFVRHPIYSGIILATLGTGLTGSVFGIVLFVIVTTMFLFRVGTEERYMMELFPGTYPAYRARTKRLVPLIW